MSLEVWKPMFGGMVLSILMLNVIQWVIYRERIYGLYTLYMLTWLAYFGFRLKEVNDLFSDNDWYFVRTGAPMIAYFIYFDFADAFIGLRQRIPGLFRLFQYTKGLIVAFLLLHLWICYLANDWYPGLYHGSHTVMRLAIVVIALYGIYRILQLKDPVVRYFISGTAFLLAGGVTSMVMTFVGYNFDNPVTLWEAPLTYFQFGIILELVCFSLGLGIRQRRAAVKTAVMEQRLARQREQHHRKQLEAELSVQQLRQEMSEVQMRALQAQLNPHFLFNSLNSLSSLITDEPRKAEQFVDEMASVYRYLLQNNDNELTTLSRELTFIHSYYHLLQTRYGRGIGLEIDVDELYLNYRLPPLTLQLLLENAVKHNIVSGDQPLKIRISTSGQGWLTVRNNLQRKPLDRVKSTKKGLLNILTKYQLLGMPAPTFQETAEDFVVSLPLIRFEK
ncbi:sensor histidine kinase [Larkinella soli]|uniref:sensor histidine kinase n=1 Tax=Larkinella soli TaxID=1770527 RepID=UPI000FFC1F91|nr:histidine kinase [Larkinella soli]